MSFQVDKTAAKGWEGKENSVKVELL